MFAPEGGLDRFVRLPYTESPAQLTDAVTRIASAWDEALVGRATGKRTPALVTWNDWSDRFPLRVRSL